MRFDVYTSDIGNYDKNLENSIIDKIKTKNCNPVMIEHPYGEHVETDINSIEDLIDFVKMHPDEQISIFMMDGKPCINYDDIRDYWEERHYNMSDDKIKEEKEMFEALNGSTIIYINDDCNHYYCLTDSGVSFDPEDLAWDEKW